MSTCLSKLICGIASLLLGSAGIIEGTRKRNTLSVAAGLLAAVIGVVSLFASAYEWLNGDEDEFDDDEDEDDEDDETDAAEEVPETAADAVKAADETVKAADDVVKAAAADAAEVKADADEESGEDA